MNTQIKKNFTLLILLLICSIFNINSLGNTHQGILFENTEFPKPYTLNDENVVVLGSKHGAEQVTSVGKVDKEGTILFKDGVMNIGYTADAQFLQTKSSFLNFLAHHNKEGVSQYAAKERLVTFKDKGTILKNIERNSTIYQKTSAVALKNGKVLIASISKVSGFGATTNVDVSLYNPTDFTSGTGFSFPATSKYLSCYEQKENDVYCIFVYEEDVFVSKLRIKHILVNGNVLVDKGDQTIKAFYTEFNFLKAIPYNETDALVLFQTGNGKKHVPYRNKGKDLYYYHLRVDSAGPLVTVQRYEYLYPDCYFDKDTYDPENCNADIAVLSPHRVYAACETELGRFRGFIIYPTKFDKEIDEFNFNNFEAENVKSPAFAKFGQSLGIFYTQITVNDNYRIAYHLLNYPDCDDFRTSPVLLPRGFLKEIEFSGKVWMSNPYPSSRLSEKVNFRFKPYGNISVINLDDNKALVADKDYSSKTTLILRVRNQEKVGKYNIYYTATREDIYDGTIVGKTCKIPFETPECLPQCESCTEKGTSDHHQCLGCKIGYYEEEDPTAVNVGYGRPHNCPRCNISCTTCYGAFLERPDRTTNCIKCDYKNNYFHYEFDERTCISNETKKYWEDYYGHAIYLDKSAGEDKKSEWRWRLCHDNCAECFERGDDIDNKCWKCKEGLYFWCNQTIGHGIPGSCHRDCVNNGFYEFIDTKEEGRKKCCECFDNCKICENNSTCKKCYYPFLLADNYTKCNKTCDYCFAEDRALGECVNCKTRYDKPKFTLNKTCVDEIPFIELIKRYHHIVDDKCNLLIGCKEGCHKCDPWYTDKCTECSADYYKQDFYNVTPQPETFDCYNKTTCQGVTPYKHDIFKRIGGVPVIENNEKVCLNCRLRNNSYRLPENDFYCSDTKIDRTYVDIEEYYKLSYCYFRCKSCDYWGNSMVMNCSTCRDGANYELFKVGKYGNCYRKVHKCGIYPYYHDYDLAEVLGKDEDNCGEDCDVCMYNFTCPEFLPFFVYETHECVEYCPITDVIGKVCEMSKRGGMILIDNPFGLRNRYDNINSTISINEIISSDIFKYIAKSYDIDINSYSKDINNYLGNGKIFNLPESKIIVGNNITIELSSVRLELEKLSKLLSGVKPTNTDASVLDLSQCSAILKKKYGLSDAEDLMIIKGDVLSQLTNQQYLGNDVAYQIFSSSLGAFLPLQDCKESGASAIIQSFLNTSKLLGEFQFRTQSVLDDGYNQFDVNSPFYNDICTPFTNEYGTDVLLDDRRADYFTQETNFCEDNCEFTGYNEKVGYFECKCPIKDSIDDKSDTEYTTKKMEIPDSFYQRYLGYSNIKVFKCASEVFSARGQKKNFGSYVLLTCLASFIGIVVFYFVKGSEMLDQIFERLSNNKSISNPPKKPSEEQPDDEVKSKKQQDNELKEKEGYPVFVKKNDIDPSTVKQDVRLSDEELNFAEYEEAKEQDKRSFVQYYWSLLKFKQLFIFTFYTSNDHNLRIIKIALFILFLSFYFAFTALFFNDSIMRQIYIYKGNTNAAVHIPNIILSSICCLIMNLIVRFISLSERDIMKAAREKNSDKRKSLSEQTRLRLKVKVIILFALSFVCMCLCWYYVSAFCAIFKNSQGHYFTNVLFCFIICNIWPCVTSLIAPIFRIKSLKEDDGACMYKFSQIISYF